MAWLNSTIWQNFNLLLLWVRQLSHTYKGFNIVSALMIVFGALYLNFPAAFFFALSYDDAPWATKSMSTCATNTMNSLSIVPSMAATKPDSFPLRASYFASERFDTKTFCIRSFLYSDLWISKSIICILQSKCCHKRQKMFTKVRGQYSRMLWLRVQGDHTGLVGAYIIRFNAKTVLLSTFCI